MPALPPPSLPSVGERLRWLIEEHLGVTHAEFARRLGVKRPQLSRWVNRADAPPGEAYVRRMAELGGVSPAWLRYGAREVAEAAEWTGAAAGVEEAAGADDRLAAEDLFRHFEGVVRRMGGADVAPEELRLRKLDVVEGLTRLYTAQGRVPDWVHQLERKVVDGEL